MNITYNNKLVSLSIIPKSNQYNILSSSTNNSMNIIQLNGFSVSRIPMLSTIDLMVNNSDYAIQYSIEGVFYYMIDSTVYLIEKYIINLQLRPV